jgi:glycosyltransferase involved in cell wall biosynthesis
MLKSNMNVLSIGTDRKIFEKDSSVRVRMIEYGRLVDSLHIIIFSRTNSHHKPEQISDNVWIYPTQSLSRFFYIRNAVKVAHHIMTVRGLDKSNTVVTTQDPFETGMVGKRLRKKYGFPLQIQLHTDLFSPYFPAFSWLNRVRLRMAKNILPLANGIRVVSPRIKRSVINRLHVPDSIIDVLPIYVEKKHEAEAPIYSKEVHKDFTFTILMVGRLAPEKNISFALDIFSEVVRKYPKTRLLIVGDGPERKKLVRRSHQLKIQHSVTFEPWQNNLEPYYAKAHTFLHTSYYEGYGMVLVEAANARLPIVTSNVGIAGDILIDGKSACVCPVNDRHCFIKKLFHVIENNSFRMEIAAKAAEAIAAATPATKDEYLKRYTELLHKAFELK